MAIQMDDGEPVVVQSTYADQETVRYPVGDLTPGWNELMHLCASVTTGW